MQEEILTTDFSSGIQRSNNSLAPSSFSNPCPAHHTTGATGTSAQAQPSTQASLSSLFHWNPGSAVGKKRKLGGGRKPGMKKNEITGHDKCPMHPKRHRMKSLPNQLFEVQLFLTHQEECPDWNLKGTQMYGSMLVTSPGLRPPPRLRFLPTALPGFQWNNELKLDGCECALVPVAPVVRKSLVIGCCYFSVSQKKNQWSHEQNLFLHFLRNRHEIIYVQLSIIIPSLCSRQRTASFSCC